MYTKYGLAALVGASSLQQVAAGSVHHRHNHQKRAIEYAATDVVVETVWTTATVTAGQQQAQEQVATDNAPAPSSTQEAKPTQKHQQPKPKPTTTEEPTAPKPQPTTLTTRTRAKSTREVPEPSTTSTTEVAPPAPTTKINTPIPEPAPTTTTTSAEQIEAAAPTAAATGSKRGAAYNDATLVNFLLGMTDEISWGYNWGSWRDDNLDENVDFIPMLWSPGNGASDWDTNVKQAIKDGATAILSFNEPDITSQANMSPEQAASDHQTYMNPYGSSSVRVGAPAVSSSEDPGLGLDWLNSWKTACNGACTFDFCSIHWYGPGGEEGAKLFIDHVKESHTACDNKPIWVTEFATTSGDEAAFMRSAFSQLDALPFVEKYSYFMISLGTLFSSLTSLSAVGDIYANIA